METATKIQKITLVSGCEILLETGFLAQQADGAVLVRVGKAMLLATVVERKEKEKGPFFPLYVDYQEKFAGAGRIPGGFLKREGRQSEYEVIISRLVDRALRPLFDKAYFNSIQVNLTLFSFDETVTVEGLVVLAASAALAVSPIPFQAPVASVQVGRQDGKLCINPTPSVIAESDLNIVVAGTAERILMLEGNAREISEATLLQVIDFAHETIKQQCQAQQALAAQLKMKKQPISLPKIDTENFKKDLEDLLLPAFTQALIQPLKGKQERIKAFTDVKETVLSTITPQIQKERSQEIAEAVSASKRKAIRQRLLASNCRIDGRAPHEIRPIHIAVGYIPSAHGSVLFTRGNTQVVCMLTLGSETEMQNLDGVSINGKKNFISNYNFPGYATGEINPRRGLVRREIGHGDMVWRALKSLLPVSPYTFRLTADTLSADGSSSMASICGGSLAFMDAGIKLGKQVAGIAMGLVYEEETKQTILLSDILSDEDAYGDADFKIAGTADGITACQMDIKTTGISPKILAQLLDQAQKGRMHILRTMDKALKEPRAKMKPQSPVIDRFLIKPMMVGAVIGPRGKVVQEMQQRLGVTFKITDEGEVTIFAPNTEAAKAAAEEVQLIICEPELKKTYKGTVKSFTQYGAFVEFLPGKEGLVHTSELSEEIVENPSHLLKIGQKIDVKLLSIIKPQNKNGRAKFSLSIKQV